MAKSTSTGATIEIKSPQYKTLVTAVVGTTPFICNRMSEKVRQSLLAPKKKTAADKAQSLKHNPMDEFRASPYTLKDDKSPTFLAFLATAFKKSMMTAALDVPGAKKTQIGRMVRVEGERLPMYGVPNLLMSVTRSADMNRTPDIRTRAILPQWAVELRITYPESIVKETSIMNLLASAGQFAGVGDWRTEKGSGNHGSFRIANKNDKELLSIKKTGNRKAQLKAMETPIFYDDESEELYEWWKVEVTERGFKIAG